MNANNLAWSSSPLEHLVDGLQHYLADCFLRSGLVLDEDYMQGQVQYEDHHATHAIMDGEDYAGVAVVDKTMLDLDVPLYYIDKLAASTSGDGTGTKLLTQILEWASGDRGIVALRASGENIHKYRHIGEKLKAEGYYVHEEVIGQGEQVCFMFDQEYTVDYLKEQVIEYVTDKPKSARPILEAA